MTERRSCRHQAPKPCAMSDCFFEFFRRAEGDFLARLDLNCFAGCGVAAHAGGALADLENAEAANTNALAFFQMLDDLADQTREDGLRLFFRQFVVFRKACSKML